MRFYCGVLLTASQFCKAVEAVSTETTAAVEAVAGGSLIAEEAVTAESSEVLVADAGDCVL